LKNDIQLPLAKEDDADYVTSLESWIYILNNMDALNLPKYSDNKIFDHLKEITDVASLSPEEREVYERDLKRYRDAYSLDMTYENGLKRAEEKGRVAERYATAKNLKLLGVAHDIIAKATGLSVEEIEEL
jgi:predicted transposase/invertase (TIGR01784 family)